MTIWTRALAVTALAALSACGGSSARAASPTGPAAELRLGYFANVTHAGPVYGVASGTYQRALGATRLRPRVLSAGPAAVEALFAGSLDAAYVGPSPAVNAFVKSGGEAVRIVAGATSGGAALVVRPGITDPGQLRGRHLADPQLGGTQDVALRTYLRDHGLHVDLQGGGDVTVLAQDNAQTLDLFRAGRIDGAWVPEPWASRLVLEAGGRVLVDEKALWPGGRFVTTNLLVRTRFLQQHPETVTALLRGQLAADRALVAPAGAAKAEARQVVDTELIRLTGRSLPPAVLARAFAGIEVTEEPLASTLRTTAEHSFATGLVPPADLRGIYDLTLLDQVLGRTVDDAGLQKGLTA